MAKKLTITIADWVYDAYLANFEGNRSEFIEGKFVIGCETELGSLENNKQKILSLNAELNNARQQIKKVLAENGRLLGYVKKERPKEVIAAEKLNKAILNSGILRDAG